MKGPILLYLKDHPNEPWVKSFQKINPDVEVRCYPNWGDVETSGYAFVWHPEPNILAQYPNLEIIFSMGAGVDHLLKDPTLPKHIPIVRMADKGLKESMAEYVIMNVLMHQRNMTQVFANQRAAIWDRTFPPTAAKTTVGIMGYGTLGAYVGDKLKSFGFPLVTWSSSDKPAENGVTHYKGQDQLPTFLAACDIVVCLLPATKDTIHILNTETLKFCKKNAAIINAGRGNTLDLMALIDSMKFGHIRAASLDVFETEPLPKNHPVWAMENIVITPHVAAVTQYKSAAQYVLNTIENYETGKSLENLLDIKKGY